jgi:hypothetical protein
MSQLLQLFFIAPSINTLFTTGILILIIFYISIINIKKIYNLNYYQKISLLCLISITVGIHGLIHLGVEKKYNFNPFRMFRF